MIRNALMILIAKDTKFVIKITSAKKWIDLSKILITIMIKVQQEIDVLQICAKVIINSDTTIVMGIELAVLMDGAKEHLDDLTRQIFAHY